ncbi:hypothetical protein [Fulvimarina endophytica]|nr:hypothetical protein [Fulvimarina endophytica]
MRYDATSHTQGSDASAMTRSALARAIEIASRERAHYHAGKAAARMKQSEASCPHPGSSQEARLWVQGFTDLQDAERAKRRSIRF